MLVGRPLNYELNVGCLYQNSKQKPHRLVTGAEWVVHIFDQEHYVVIFDQTNQLIFIWELGADVFAYLLEDWDIVGRFDEEGSIDEKMSV